MASHETLFDNVFNEAYGMVKFGDLSFEPATILKECDPIAYRCAVSDYDCDGDPECDECEPDVDPYNVYALMDGIVCEDEYHWGNMIAEVHVSATDYLNNLESE